MVGSIANSGERGSIALTGHILHSAAATGRCDETYGFLPCSTSIGGNIFLMLVYGTMLLVAAKLISDGSELLLQVLDPGIIGGLLLPILGSFPDALLIVVSGVGGTQAEAQEQVLVGMGVLAGSTIMLLTIAWSGSLFCGRCDLTGPHGTAKERTLTRGWSPTETGVTTDEQTRLGAWIMIASILPYVVVQIPILDNQIKSQGRWAALIGCAVSVAGLIAYCVYQVTSPWLQSKQIGEAKMQYLRSVALRDLQRLSADKSWGGLLMDDGVTPNPDTLELIFRQFDENNDGELSRSELKGLIVGLGIRHQGTVPSDEEVATWMRDFDTNSDGVLGLEEFIVGLGQWITTVQKVHIAHTLDKAAATLVKKPQSNGITEDSHAFLESIAKEVGGQLATMEEDTEEEEAEEEPEVPLTRSQIIQSAILYMFGGALLVAIFADPMVDAISGFSTATGIPSFFVAFVVSPIASNASELVSSFVFALKKKKRTISLTYSQVYGAITMNNTLCLGVFLLLVYLRGLVWEFSSEVTVIIISTLVVGVVAATRRTFQTWLGWAVLLLYPFSLALVAFLDNVLGWQ